MSEITWAQLTEAEREALKTIGLNNREFSQSPLFVGLYDKGLTWIDSFDDEIFGYTKFWRLTDLGRAVLAQADTAPAATEARPTTITVRDYYRQNFIAKVAKKECTVSIPEFPGSWIEDVDEQGDLYLVKFQDYEGPNSMTYVASNPLTVQWLTQQPAPSKAEAGDGAGEAQTFGELCEREIVKIRELTLKDDKYTSHLLGEAVGSPVGITMCVQARMEQIADLQVQVKALNTLNEKLVKQVLKLKRTTDLDEGFIDFLTEKGDNYD